MLGFINRNRSDHPLADEKGAREFFADLPTQDPFKTLEELAHSLDATRTAEGLKPLRVFEIVDSLDTAGRPHQRKLLQEFVAGGVRLQRFQENRICTTIVEYWRQLGAAYEFCLTLTLPGVPGSGALKAHTPVIAARALRALAAEIKWALARYGPIDPTLWGRMGALYTHAEERGYATQVVAVSPGAQGESTVQREYLKVLMLAMSATDTLLPRKLEVAERIVAQFCDRFVFSRQPDKGCHCTIDLRSAKPPVRVVGTVPPAPGLRYFGPGAAGEIVDEVIDKITESGAIPSSINLGGNYEPGFVVTVLRHLARQWSSAPPARQQERRRSIARIHVVHDFDDVVSMIAGEFKDLDFQRNIETWTVENESEGGYGALIPDSATDWLRVGTLLAIKLADGNAWGVGIVRRLSNGPNTQRYVGIQTLAKGAARVKLMASEPNGDADSGDDAVLLPSSASDSMGTGELSVLMRLGTFSPKQSLRMRAYERDYLLVPKQLIEGGQDFDMAKFRVLARSS